MAVELQHHHRIMRKGKSADDGQHGRIVSRTRQSNATSDERTYAETSVMLPEGLKGAIELLQVKQKG